ncbi:hypothetical protein BV898_09316 [Hypsibius exemplaris]|uniref:Uncharacterized protein n=1 Tax=Hypsibius exemplaris TaxID=2072580 RepID=A0A1W0WN55_HYPEX|nr:hypothetical protein BV898_09316 [Hypsibius exemplaris]
MTRLGVVIMDEKVLFCGPGVDGSADATPGSSHGRSGGLRGGPSADGPGGGCGAASGRREVRHGTTYPWKLKAMIALDDVSRRVVEDGTFTRSSKSVYDTEMFWALRTQTEGLFDPAADDINGGT